jgi:arylsulfatase
MATGFPGYDGSWPREAASIAEILKGNHYSTAAFGKWHNTPDHELSAAGHSTAGRRQGLRLLVRVPGRRGEPMAHAPLREHRADRASARRSQLAFLGSHRREGDLVDQPAEGRRTGEALLPLLRAGCVSQPAPRGQEWADKYKGQFDHGWDRQREITFENQKKLGLVPENTKLTPRPDSIPSWDSRRPTRKRLYARMQEVFAGFLEHVDAQVGKVVDAIERMGCATTRSSSTSSATTARAAKGSLTGTLNNMKTQLGLSMMCRSCSSASTSSAAPAREPLPGRLVLGGIIAVQWMKQVASHFGGRATAS